jgi:hypothetical protein
MSYKTTISTILDSMKEAGATSFKSKDLAVAVGCTYQTIMNYIKANPDKITKIRHGVYGFVTESTISVTQQSHNPVVEQYQINTPDQNVQPVVHEEMTTVSEVISSRPAFES